MDKKLTRILLKDTSKEIPVKLRDPFLEETVELKPDAIVSKEYAKLLISEFPFLYAEIDKKEELDLSAYRFRQDFKEPEFKALFSELTPDEKEHICSYIEKLIEDRGKDVEKELSDETLTGDNTDASTDTGATE